MEQHFLSVSSMHISHRVRSCFVFSWHLASHIDSCVRRSAWSWGRIVHRERLGHIFTNGMATTARCVFPTCAMLLLFFRYNMGVVFRGFRYFGIQCSCVDQTATWPNIFAKHAFVNEVQVYALRKLFAVFCLTSRSACAQVLISVKLRS